jgi:Ser-tRNA(Ala) deacylase AlaX
METPTLNEAKKTYNEPMHTCEHILNQTMVRMFGCGRSVNAHIERRKSKCDYLLTQAPTAEQIAEITRKVNEIIQQDLPVTEELMSKKEAAKIVDLSKLPEEVSETLRIIRVGEYDACACIGQHVDNTSELGTFEIISHDFENGRWRIRFKLV